MPVELELPAARSQRGAQNGLAFEDVGRILFQWDVVQANAERNKYKIHISAQ